MLRALRSQSLSQKAPQCEVYWSSEPAVLEPFPWPRIMNTIISGHNRNARNGSAPPKGMPNAITAANSAIGTKQHRSINHMCQPEPWLCAVLVAVEVWLVDRESMCLDLSKSERDEQQESEPDGTESKPELERATVVELPAAERVEHLSRAGDGEHGYQR